MFNVQKKVFQEGNSLSLSLLLSLSYNIEAVHEKLIQQHTIEKNKHCNLQNKIKKKVIVELQ